MKKGFIILAIIVIYFAFMGNKSINKQKDDNVKILDMVTIVKDGKIDSKNDGKLVLVTGKLDYEKIKLDEIDSPIDSFKVCRKVEKYKKVTKSNGEITNDWVEIRESDVTDNYDLPLEERLYTKTYTSNVKVGEFALGGEGLERIKCEKIYKSQENVGSLSFTGLYYSNPDHEDDYVLGDINIHYDYYDTSDGYISVLAKQYNGSFTEYSLDKKKSVFNIYKGKVNSKELLEKELDASTKTSKKGKLLFILMIIGVGTFFILDNRKK